MRHLPRRLRNLALRFFTGLPPSSLAVSPQLDSDLFQAHLALYHFAGRFAAGKRVLDLGCGTGYGIHDLLEQGAREAVGIDVDRTCVAAARKRFGGPRARFELGDAEALAPDLGRFELVTAINVLVQLRDPRPALAAAARCLAPSGTLVASVPPILDGQTMDLHRTLPTHRSNLYLWDWEDQLRAHFGQLALYRQVPPPGRLPDLGSAGPPRVFASEYVFDEIPLAELYDVGSFTAIFVATLPKTSP